MGWLYHTDISPTEKPNNSFNEAFDICLNQCLIHEDRVIKELDEFTKFRFTIRTDGNYDKIPTRDGRIYLKSIFLKNKTFKKKLIDYYKPLGIYVKGPVRLDKRNGDITNRWLIELSPKYLN